MCVCGCGYSSVRYGAMCVGRFKCGIVLVIVWYGVVCKVSNGTVIWCGMVNIVCRSSEVWCEVWCVMVECGLW